jgi:hypothetical protein
MKNNVELDYNNDSVWDVNSIINFIKDNYVQILLLISVFVIIYIVDHISNINAILYGLPSAIPSQVNITKKQKKSKK